MQIQRRKRVPDHADCAAATLKYELLRGTIVNRTYGTHKNLNISLFLLTIFWSYLPWSPVLNHRNRPGIYLS